jgi:hypothetical protein
MSYDFPASPVSGQEFTPPGGGQTYVFVPPRWLVKGVPPAAVNGPPGPTGPAGPTGPTGPMGATGPAGPDGPVGPAGAKGDTGTTGAAGPQGVTGAQGPQGVKGDTGATGSAGAQGVQGVKGDTGAAGPTGAQGPQGLPGNTGATGAAGAPGATGPAGADSTVPGPKGDKGDKGDTGDTGPAGASDWASISGKPATFPPDAHTHPFSAITGTLTDAQHGLRGNLGLHALATSAAPGFMTDAVNDGKPYVRRSAAWEALGQVTVVGSTTDWNTITKPGLHPELLGPGCANAPVASEYYFCEVHNYGANVTQLAIPYSLNTSISKGLWYRGVFGGTWGPWVGLATKTADARNRFINGAMQISQQYGDALIGLGYPADQWNHSYISTGAATAQRVQTVTPNKSKDRLQFKVTTADTSIAAGEYWLIMQRLEGLNIEGFGWGAAGAKQVVLRFGIKGPAGTYAVAIRNGAANRSFIATFTIANNVDTEQVIVIPGDVTGTWPSDETHALQVAFTFCTGATFVGVLGWQAGNFVGGPGMSNGLLTVGNTFELWDVGLYLDPDNTGVPPKWEAPDVATEMIKCQRYWQSFYGLWNGAGVSSANFLAVYVIPITPRTTPALAASGGTGTLFPTSGTLSFVNSQTLRDLRTCSGTGYAMMSATYIVDARV